MKFGLARTKKFKKSFKKLHLKDNNEAIYIDAVSKLLNGIALDKKYNDHFLKGNPGQYKECHLKPDLLLIYRVYRDEVQLIDIGSHSELFE
ncbi:MAG: type II toxin-antitoxin system YafQ family toxin [Thermodesulfobacteriota bacterium]|nr:type II toxin-antitoxin system YafQ family toxin [Thermodesulfobacteriota bacterium]